jgi:hypothetical protein
MNLTCNKIIELISDLMIITAALLLVMTVSWLIAASITVAGAHEGCVEQGYKTARVTIKLEPYCVRPIQRHKELS